MCVELKNFCLGSLEKVSRATSVKDTTGIPEHLLRQAPWKSETSLQPQQQWWHLSGYGILEVIRPGGGGASG